MKTQRTRDRKRRCVCAALCLILAGCAPLDSGAPMGQADGTVTQAATGKASEAAPAPETEVTFAEVVKTAAEALNAQEPGADGSLTRAQWSALLDAVGALGAPCTANPYMEQDLRNPEAVRGFCRAVEEKRDAAVSVFEIDRGQASERRFESRGGAVTLTTQRWAYGEEEPVKIRDGDRQPLDRFELWESGWLVWHAQGREEGDGWAMRVDPLGEENIVLGDTYVDWLVASYSMSGAVTRRWDESDVSRLNWDLLFEAMLHARGRELMEYAPPGSDPEGHGEPYSVPAADVEPLLAASFPVTVEQLRTLPAYDAGAGIYRFFGFRGGGYYPLFEVTGKTEQPDGSLTLHVAVRSPDRGRELEFSFSLTVMPGADGTPRYLRNVTGAKNADAPSQMLHYGDELLGGVLPEGANVDENGNYWTPKQFDARWPR